MKCVFSSIVFFNLIDLNVIYYSLFVFRARAGPEVFTSPCPATRITVGGDDTPKCTCSRPTIRCRTTWKEPFGCSGGSSVWSRREEDTGLGEETTCGWRWENCFRHRTLYISLFWGKKSELTVNSKLWEKSSNYLFIY